MEKRDFYLTNEQLKDKTLELMAGSWNKYASMTLLYFITIIACVGGAIVSWLLLDWYFALLITIFAVWLFTLFNYGYNVFCLENVRNTKSSKTLFLSGFGKNAVKILLVFICKITIIALGLAFFIVPGIMFIISLSNTNFVIRHNPNLKLFAIFKKCFKLQKANSKRFISMFLEFSGWFSLGIISAGIAFIWILPYYVTEKAVYYEDLLTDF